MGQFAAFVVNHWVLWLMFVLISAVLFLYEMNTKSGRGHKVSPQDAVQLINRKHAIVLDIRSEDEFKRGHIINSIFMPIDELESRLSKLKKNKAKPVLLVCTAGLRVEKVAKALVEQQFENVYVLAGGLTAWKQANCPLESS
ncbi:MAG: hypothetical protein A3F17_08265 [Gammaproteobacteria bacterium RIFCSPHIGHO2_12_FULL_41_15]|nr:MAG: hypothetical protein A3F17_08265 [Gammaproteobacteria bacterium RIFCSPHIGHO2_12_FULL_41_15]